MGILYFVPARRFADGRVPDVVKGEALSALGLSGDRIARLASPFGLVPSARDPRTLAASVLAQVLDRARLA